MASKLKIKVNGLVHNVTASLDTPLLYVLHNELHLHGPRFGCGLAHCGYCHNGMMIQAADLLSTTKNPTEDQIRTAMNGHLCRCGTYPRILTAIKQAAGVMAKGGK